VRCGEVIGVAVIAGIHEDGRTVFAKDREPIFAEYVFAFLRFAWVQLPLCPFRSLIALLLHAGDFLLSFLK